MANILHTEREANKITLGTTGTTINIASHTASRLLALDASKNLESITDLIVDTTNHRVGIGTTTPSLKFDVKGTANTSYANCPLLMQVHTLDAYAAGMGGGISLGGEYGSVNTTTFGYIAGLKENANEGDYAGKLVFGTRVDGSGAADFTRMTILSSGNVGINTTTPDTKLQVVGDCKFGDDNTNYTALATDGLQTMVGTARVINTIWLPATGMKSVGAKAAVFVEHGLSGAYQFTDGADDQIVGSIRIPNRMDREVAPTISIGWSATAIVGNCNWQLEYLWTKANEDTNAGAQDTHTEAATVSGTAEGMTLTTFDALDLPDSDDICLHFRLSREADDDPPDTLVGDAELHGICMSFISNKLGTAT